MLAAHARLACSSGHASTSSEQPCGAAGPSTPSDALPSAIASQLLTRHDLTPTLQPPTSHATMQARAASSHAELPGLPRLQMLARLSPLCARFSLAMAHTHAATAPRTHVVAGPRHGAAEGPTITPYPPLVTDIPPTLLVAQILHKARAASHPQQHCAPCSSITLHSSITEAEAARSASTCLRS